MLHITYNTTQLYLNYGARLTTGYEYISTHILIQVGPSECEWEGMIFVSTFCLSLY